MTSALSRRPGAVAVAGALTIAFSAILVKLADVEPSTAAIFRCAYALPLLWLIAHLEDRRFGSRPLRGRRIAIPAGIFFAADLIFWHHAIGDVGAGLATVLGNLQVVVVPFAAWALLGERVGLRILAALPLICSGVVLISGVLETGAYGDHPLRGVLFGLLTGLSYAGFLLVLRQAAPTSGVRPARCSTPRWSRPSRRSSRVSPSARRTSCPTSPRMVADHARAHLAGARLAADHRLAPAPARCAHLGDADDPAGRLGACWA